MSLRTSVFAVVTFQDLKSHLIFLGKASYESFMQRRRRSCRHDNEFTAKVAQAHIFLSLSFKVGLVLLLLADAQKIQS